MKCRPFLALLVVALVAVGGYLGRPSRLEPEMMQPYERWVNFRAIRVYPKERVLVIEQLLADANDSLVGTRIPVREDALIVFQWLVQSVERRSEWESLRSGRLEDIRPGQGGGLILGKDGRARYIIIGERYILIPPGD